MKLKVIEKNAAAIESALRAVNGKSRTNAYTEYHEIATLAADFRARLGALQVPKSRRAGATIVRESGGQFPTSYKYKAHTTIVTLLANNSGDVFLIRADARERWPSEAPACRLLLPADQWARAVNRFLSDHDIHEHIAPTSNASERV